MLIWTVGEINNNNKLQSLNAICDIIILFFIHFQHDRTLIIIKTQTGNYKLKQIEMNKELVPAMHVYDYSDSLFLSILTKNSCIFLLLKRKKYYVVYAFTHCIKIS